MKAILHALYTTIALCVASLSSAAPQAAGEPADPSADAQPIYWPQAARPKLAVNEYSMRFDGHPVSMLQLQSSKVAIEIAKRPDFSLSPPSSPRYSSEIRSSSIPGIAIGLSYFRADEFLPDLSPASWEAYKAGLKAERPTEAMAKRRPPLPRHKCNIVSNV